MKYCSNCGKKYANNIEMCDDCGSLSFQENVNVHIIEETDDFYHQEGDDYKCTIPLSFNDYIKGAPNYNLPIFKGKKLIINVPPKFGKGKKLQIKGKEVFGEDHIGDIYVTVNVEITNRLFNKSVENDVGNHVFTLKMKNNFIFFYFFIPFAIISFLFGYGLPFYKGLFFVISFLLCLIPVFLFIMVSRKNKPIIFYENAVAYGNKNIFFNDIERIEQSSIEMDYNILNACTFYKRGNVEFEFYENIYNFKELWKILENKYGFYIYKRHQGLFNNLFGIGVRRNNK